MPESTARPTFNVVEAFSGVTVSQLNDQFRELLADFLSDIEDTEPEISALQHALRSPVRSWTLQDGTSFNVSEPFAGVTIIQFNESFRELLVGFFDEVDELEPEIRAFRYALNDPKKSRALREQRQELKRNGFRTTQGVTYQ